MTLEIDTNGAQIVKRTANQVGAIPQAIDARKNTRVAWPDGNEWGSVFLYISPHSPSGLRLLIENFNAIIIIANKNVPLPNAAVIRCHSPLFRSQIINSPPRQYQESPLWANNVAKNQRHFGFSLIFNFAVYLMSHKRND